MLQVHYNIVKDDYKHYPLNTVSILLVPKIENANNMNEFIPITSYNLLYKCYSKILASSVKVVLHDLTASTQNAFFKAMQIF